MSTLQDDLPVIARAVAGAVARATHRDDLGFIILIHDHDAEDQRDAVALFTNSAHDDDVRKVLYRAADTLRLVPDPALESYVPCGTGHA